MAFYERKRSRVQTGASACNVKGFAVYEETGERVGCRVVLSPPGVAVVGSARF